MTKEGKVVALVAVCIFIILCAMDESIFGCVIGAIALMIIGPLQEKAPKNNKKNNYKPKI
jgi:hypothetical protein